VEVRRVLLQRRFLFVGLFLAATIVAGCTGGSTAVAPSAQASASASPGSSNTQLVAIPSTAGTVALQAVAGITPGFGIGSGAPAGLTMNVTGSVTAPANAPAPTSIVRKSAAAVSATPFLYVTATFSANVPAGVIGSELLQLSNALPAGNQYFCEIDDLTPGSATKIGTFGPVLPSGGVVTIVNGTAANAPSFTAGHTYLFQFYSLPVSTASPSPSASPSASATASSSPSPSPSPTGTGTSTPTASPSPQGTVTPLPAFNFSGPTASSTTVTPPTVPGAIVVPATGPGYGTYAAHVSIQFGAATTTAPYSLTVALGSTANDISPAASFPFYTGSQATPLFYALFTTNALVSFSQTPQITVNVNSFGSTNTCSLFIYASSNGATPFAWTQVPGTSVNVTGTSVIIPPAPGPPGETIDFTPGKTQLAFIGC
jgi:hypothetical protein